MKIAIAKTEIGAGGFGGILVPRRFVRKYTRLIKRAGFQVKGVIADPFPGVNNVPHSIVGHHLLKIATVVSVEREVKLLGLIKRWERMLENEN